MRYLLHSPFEIYLRIIFSMFVGIIIGFERAIYHKPAGVRTFSLVCMGSTLIMLISAYGADYLGLKESFDPFRIAAQIVSGIGFIGAGVIWNGENGAKHGITTASELWVVSAMGMALGVGMYDLVILLMICIFLVMRIGNMLERYADAKNKVKSEFSDMELIDIELTAKKSQMDEL